MKKVQSYAKVNLMLKVISKNTNGYHELQMLNKRINLYDEITIEYSDFDNIYITENIDITLMNKVLKRIKDIYNIEKNYSIKIEKYIPVGAGLGGASVNASTIVDTILEMENITDTLENKIRNFQDLGADIPYGFVDDLAIVEGIGEKIYIIKEEMTRPLVLVNPGVFISTKAVFENNNVYTEKYSHLEITNNINNSYIYSNDLEQSTFNLNKELYILKRNLEKYGKVVMSGTGSSFIVHTENIEKIKAEHPNYLVMKIN